MDGNIICILRRYYPDHCQTCNKNPFVSFIEPSEALHPYFQVFKI